MYDTKIAHISYYVPEMEVSISEFLKQLDTKDLHATFTSKADYIKFITEDLGVASIRVEDKLDDTIMLANTVEQIFAAEATEPDHIDLIILAQEHDQRQKLNLGQFIQYEFELKNAYVLNLDGNHCANIDHALTLASQIAQGNERINNILVLGNVKIDNPAHRLVGTYGVISDGSGAMLINKSKKGLSLKSSRAVSAGRFHHVDLNQDNSLMLCKYYVKTLSELLAQAGVNPEAVTHIITQNGNPLLTNQCLEMVGLDTAKIFSANQTRYSHLDCLDFLVNLKDLQPQLATTKNDELILTFGTGWAGSFIGSLLTNEQ